MKHALVALLASLPVLMAGGCAIVAFARLEPGTSTEADLRRALGEPCCMHAGEDGTRQLVYPQGPEGLQTWMAWVSPDGTLVRLEQSLSSDSLRRIEVGSTTTAELERLIGPPWRKVAFPALRQVAWDYVVLDDWGYTVDFSVMVDERGVVASTVHARRETGDAGLK